MEVIASHRWLRSIACALFAGALVTYAFALTQLAVIIDRPGCKLVFQDGWDMLLGVGRPYGASALEVGLWSLNLLVFASPLLWGLRPRRMYVLAPIVALCGAFWLWAATPSSDGEIESATTVWQIESGFYLWLGSIAALVVAITSRWIACTLAWRGWARRNSGTSEPFDPATIAHLSPTLRVVIEDAADLRRLLELTPGDERLPNMLWDWVMRVQRLPEVDAAELERLRVPTRSVYAAVEPLWLTECTLGPVQRARVDEALASFIATASTGGATAFR